MNTVSTLINKFRDKISTPSGAASKPVANQNHSACPARKDTIPAISPDQFASSNAHKTDAPPSVSMKQCAQSLANSQSSPLQGSKPENSSKSLREDAVSSFNDGYKSLDESSEKLRHFYLDRNQGNEFYDLELRIKKNGTFTDKRVSEYGLTGAELIAVRDYSGGAYREMNQALLSGDPKRIEKISPLIDLTCSALKKMPPFHDTCDNTYDWVVTPKGDLEKVAIPKGRVYRVMLLSPQQLSAYKVGATIENKSFTSTTHFEARLYKYADPDAKNLKHVKLVIDTAEKDSKGKSIEWMSAFPQEREVLFEPGTSFVVLSSYGEDNLQGLPPGKMPVIHMKEVPSQAKK